MENPDAGPALDTGVFVISIDVELAWGIRDHLSARALQGLDAERAIVERLLTLFRSYNVSATWAIVGGLLGADAWRTVQLPPGLTLDPSQWHAADIVQRVREAVPQQEVGSHSFAHTIFDERTLSREEASADVLSARQAHAAAGLPFEAFVFPRNVVGFPSVLADNGVRVFRGATPRWYSMLPGPLFKPGMFLDYLLAATPPVLQPSIVAGGMVNVADSMLLLGRNGVRSLIPHGNLTRMGTNGLAHQMEAQFGVLDSVLRHASMLREKGALRFLTMGGLAETCVNGRAHGR